MKTKFRFLAFLVICGLLFSALSLTGCDWLFEDTNETEENEDNNGNDQQYEDNNGNDQQIVGVEPLTQSQWWQYSPYNDLFPMASESYTLPVDNNTGRTLTDCSNTALAQILYYHKHPKQGIGQSTKLWPMHFYGQTGDVYVNLEVPFDWNNMLNSYTNANPGTVAQRNAVATLMYHTAAAMGAADASLCRALVNILGYDRSIQIHHRSFYANAEWEAIIRKQLDLRLPIYYSGTHPGGSHNFVVDGYDDNGKFHINWGWEGRHDGWYSLDNLNPTGERSYYDNQFIVINIKPEDDVVSNDNEFGLTAFTAGKYSVSQNELLTVTPTIKSFCYFPGGQAGVALVNNNGGIAAVIGTRNMGTTWQPGSQLEMEMNCFIPETVSPGQYRLMAVTRIEGGEWKIITVSAISDDVPNAINITVTTGEANGGGYGLGLLELTASKTVVSRGEQFELGYRFINVGTDTFSGETGPALVDNDNNIKTVVRSWNTGNFVVGARNSNPVNVTCTVPNIVATGTYRLRMVVRPSGGEWRIATISVENSPTSIDFEVR